MQHLGDFSRQKLTEYRDKKIHSPNYKQVSATRQNVQNIFLLHDSRVFRIIKIINTISHTTHNESRYSLNFLFLWVKRKPSAGGESPYVF